MFNKIFEDYFCKINKKSNTMQKIDKIFVKSLKYFNEKFEIF